MQRPYTRRKVGLLNGFTCVWSLYLNGLPESDQTGFMEELAVSVGFLLDGERIGAGG